MSGWRRKIEAISKLETASIDKCFHSLNIFLPIDISELTSQRYWEKWDRVSVKAPHWKKQEAVLEGYAQLGQQIFVAAVRAFDPDETETQVAAIQVSIDHIHDIWPPVAVAEFVAFIPGHFQFFKIRFDEKEIFSTVGQKAGRVAPADCSTGALARSVRGRFDHTAPPLIRLMKFPRCIPTPLAWETLSITLKSPSNMFSGVIAPVMFPS